MCNLHVVCFKEQIKLFLLYLNFYLFNYDKIIEKNLITLICLFVQLKINSVVVELNFYLFFNTI